MANFTKLIYIFIRLDKPDVRQKGCEHNDVCFLYKEDQRR